MTFYLHPYPYRRMARRWVENNQHALGVSIHEEGDDYILSALVPGLKADDLQIQVLGDVVRIDGEYKTDENHYLMQELPNGSFTRTLQMPAAIDADHVDAKIANGVLTLRLPRSETARPKKINITSK